MRVPFVPHGPPYRTTKVVNRKTSRKNKESKDSKPLSLNDVGVHNYSLRENSLIPNTCFFCLLEL